MNNDYNNDLLAIDYFPVIHFVDIVFLLMKLVDA